jgi:hypothetical protein
LLLVASAPTETIVLLLFVFFSAELFFVLEGTAVRRQIRGASSCPALYFALSVAVLAVVLYFSCYKKYEQFGVIR